MHCISLINSFLLPQHLLLSVVPESIVMIDPLLCLLDLLLPYASGLYDPIISAENGRATEELVHGHDPFRCLRRPAEGCCHSWVVPLPPPPPTCLELLMIMPTALTPFSTYLLSSALMAGALIRPSVDCLAKLS